MKKLALLASLLAIFGPLGALAAPKASNPKPFVIPEIKSWQGSQGDFVPAASTRIVCAGDEALLRVARQLSDDWAELFGPRMEVTTGRAAKGDIMLSLKADKQLGEEGYAIRTTDRVAVTAPTAEGLYWATRTLLQIAEQTPDRRLPCGSMRDWPDYALRGLMIDCGRKFIPMPFLRDWVKIMAYYKMNALQIHLNDNGFKQYYGNDWDKTYAAFRLESETFPGLAARDGSYSKREFVELQKLAEERFVEIIPEIDAPAHTLAFSHYKPELGSKEYGMDHMDLFNPETYRFLDALFKEYLEGDEPVFRGRTVHIGTDEYSNKDPEVVEKFRAFTDRYIRYVEGFGKQAAVWGSLTHAAGKTPVKVDDVVMFAWSNGYADPKAMKELGYKLVSIPDGYLYIVPAAGYYYDYLNTRMLYEKWTPANINGVQFEERDPAILGGMFAVWNDHCGNGISTRDIHDRLFPALQTLSVKMWSGAEAATLPFEAFDERRTLLSEAPGVNLAGRIGPGPGKVYEAREVAAGSRTPHREIGYGYRVEFDLDCAEEKPGTVLFRSPDAVVYLADPVRGMLGFARDGYLNTFSWRPLPGEHVRIAIEGDNRATRLFVDGRLVDELDIRDLWFNEGKARMRDVRTLAFPLAEAGDFRSRVTNLEVHRLK